ncbi:MAG: hypothetical protein J6K80_06340 [Oscillospiraceae bacterium]|nr:hypothetical protein [Oscillospiraceae bacterium]
MNKDKKSKYKAPRMGDRTGYKPTPATMARTYDERILEEMKETLAATVYAETFPDRLDYENPANQEK